MPRRNPTELQPRDGYTMCEVCEKPMTPGSACIDMAWVFLDDEDRHVTLNRVLHGDEGDPWPTRDDLNARPAGERFCHDCNCGVGAPHHQGCDVERCPRCRRQAMSCDCMIVDIAPPIFKENVRS